ncbi:MAG: Hsp20/alpha crystallin family protein [Vampirovibrio sp.]|nr:Hsp20/alpha crystallin family protein [Vampirovibrio sp.]
MSMMKPLFRVRGGDMNSLMSDMDALFEPFFLSSGDNQSSRRSYFPQIDVLERDDALEVKAAIPGYKSEDIEIDLDQNTLTISGHRDSVEEAKEGNYYHREIIQGKFSRSMTLPADVAPDQTEATFKDGVLTVTLPKAVASRKHQIQIK